MLVLFCSLFSARSTQVEYIPASKNVPKASANAPFFYTDSNTLVLFTDPDNKDLLNCVNIFNLTSFEWRVIRISSYFTPPHIKSSANFYYKGSLYVIGGLSSKGPIGDIWKFSLRLFKWDLISFSGNLPKLYAAGYSAHTDSKTTDFYLFGGYTGTSINSQIFK